MSHTCFLYINLLGHLLNYAIAKSTYIDICAFYDILLLSYEGLYEERNSSHSELPWINAHTGYGEKEHCTEAITHEAIADYFMEMHRKYNLSTDEGVRAYIASLGVV